MNEVEQPEEALFDAALRLPGEVRARFLIQACGDDPDLRRRLDALLAAHDRAGGFMKQPASMQASAGAVEEHGRIGRYQLLRPLGEGGCGVVYLAEQEKPIRRQVALKVIKLGMDTREVIARFDAERQALALMDHPSIARVFDAGATEAGRPYFVMELVHGIRITDYCDFIGLPPEGRLKLFIQVCQAVQHAHQKGVIHRDLKPSNILVTIVDGEAVPKVIDFGIAKATQGPLTDQTLFTAMEQFVGTPIYMSPEQAGHDVDTRSDIYSLGVLLYELLTGRPPFDERDLLRRGMAEMLRVIREEDPPCPSTRLSALDAGARTATASRRHTDPPKLIHLIRGDLDWIVMKCLEKDRTRRYETASGLAADLQRYLSCEPVGARPPSRWYGFQKAVRRHRVGFAAATALFFVLALGVTVSTSQAVRATKAERQALAETARATSAEQLAKDRFTEVAAERDQKDQARKDAEAISTFLTEVFQSPDPEKNGREIKVAELLDKAAEKLATDLAAQPADRAKLQVALGSSYYALGLYREAIPLQEKARDYYLAVCGLEHPYTLKAMNLLANSYFAGGRREEALKLREQVLELRREVSGLEHTETLIAMGCLASSYTDASRRDEALKLHEEALALRRKVSGPEHPETLTTMNNLASFLNKFGRWDEALKLQEEVLALRRKVSGPETPHTLTAMNNLAASYSYAGRRGEALKLTEEVLALRRKVSGPEHPDTILAMYNLSVFCFEVGRRDEGIKLSEEVLALRRKVNGPEHPNTLTAMHSLALSYSEVGRRDEALKLSEEVLALHKKVLGPEDPTTLGAMELVGSCYFRDGRRDEALKLAEEVLGLHRKVLGPEHPHTLTAMRNLATSYTAVGRNNEAVKLSDDALRLSRKALGSDHPKTQGAVATLSKSLMDAGRMVEALPLLAETSIRNPKDTGLSLKLAALQAWFGKDAEHAATCVRAIDAAEQEPVGGEASERAAKSWCLKPANDPVMLGRALALARKAASSTKAGVAQLPWFLQTLGMAEFRAGHDQEAEAALVRAIQLAETDNWEPKYRPHIRNTSRIFRAMILFRAGKAAEARELFRQAEAEMPPLPENSDQTLPADVNHDQLIQWLGAKEARALLANPDGG